MATHHRISSLSSSSSAGSALVLLLNLTILLSSVLLLQVHHVEAKVTAKVEGFFIPARETAASADIVESVVQRHLNGTGEIMLR